MKMIVAVTFLCLFGFSVGMRRDTDIEFPTSTCFCVTASKLHIRSSADLSSRHIIGAALKGECFIHTGHTTNADGFEWMSVAFKDKEAWASKDYMKPGNQSLCSAKQDACLGKGGPFDSACLSCICEVESGCKPIGCHMDVGSLSCGYYQIKKPYYTDCHSPGSGWQACSDDFKCATTCVQNYIGRYYKHCTGYATPECCEDAARIHNGGPKGCQKSATLGYWKKVQTCLQHFNTY